MKSQAINDTIEEWPVLANIEKQTTWRFSFFFLIFLFFSQNKFFVLC